MHRNHPSRFAVGSLLALCGAVALGVMGVVTAKAETLMTSLVPQDVANRSARLVATPQASRELQVAIALPMRNRAQLEQLIRDLYDPSSPSYRHYLSVAQFTERFGPTQADYTKALQYFSKHGLAITSVSANRYLIEGSARIDTLERLLHVKFGLYRRNGETRQFIAPDREPTLDLGVPVLSIIGLDDANPPTNRLIQHQTALDAGSPVTGSGPNGWYLGSDMRTAYYGGVQLTGAGQSVGLMELGAFDPQGVENYFTKFGPPLTAAVVPISTDGTAPTCASKCNDGEQDLDIEYAIAMAPGLSQVQVYVAKSAESVLNRMASDNTSAQLSTSWGWNENSADDPIFMEMAAQGQTLLTASGDYSSLRASGPWPEESAWITGVGGTDLQTNGAGGAWSGETGWSGSAGGPSLDTSISIPDYQVRFINTRNKGSTTLRNVPDIAAAANYFYICDSGGCSGGNAGTSFASPIWAGYIALANQEAASRGLPRIGFLNPLVYDMVNKRNYAKVFHDVASGRSGKNNAVKGFDLVTGLGSPYGSGFINRLLYQVGN